MLNIRPTQILSLSLAANIFLIPGVNAVLGFHCLKALHSLDTPRFARIIQEDACKAGCQPRSANWASHGKELMRGLIEDGTAYTHINEGQTAVVDFMDRLFENLQHKCEETLGSGHMCQDEGSMMSCVEQNSRWAELNAMPALLPFASEERCRLFEQYLSSDQLWEKDLPTRMQAYTSHCRDDLK